MPEAPELTVDTSVMTAEAAVERLMQVLSERGIV
jgi:adenylylsulfate kinase-like enzyme